MDKRIATIRKDGNTYWISYAWKSKDKTYPAYSHVQVDEVVMEEDKEKGQKDG